MIGHKVEFTINIVDFLFFFYKFQVLLKISALVRVFKYCKCIICYILPWVLFLA